jgi:hypothetical protein
MPEPLESDLTDATLESDALPQEGFPPGDVRRHPEAPGHLYLGQAAAVPTSDQPQVPSEDHLIYEFEIDDGEAPQPPASSGSQAAPTVTTGGVVGDPLQQHCLLHNFTSRSHIGTFRSCLNYEAKLATVIWVFRVRAPTNSSTKYNFKNVTILNINEINQNAYNTYCKSRSLIHISWLCHEACYGDLTDLGVSTSDGAAPFLCEHQQATHLNIHIYSHTILNINKFNRNAHMLHPAHIHLLAVSR